MQHHLPHHQPRIRHLEDPRRVQPHLAPLLSPLSLRRERLAQAPAPPLQRAPTHHLPHNLPLVRPHDHDAALEPAVEERNVQIRKRFEHEAGIPVHVLYGRVEPIKGEFLRRRLGFCGGEEFD